MLKKKLLISLVFTIFFLVMFSSSASAAQLNEAYLRLDRMKASTATGGTVCAMIATPGSTDTSIRVTFPTGFSVNTTASNWTVTTTNLPAGSTAMPGIGTANLVSGQDVTFPISNITSNSTLYCFNFSGTSTLTNPTAGTDLAGVITVQATGPATIDSGAYATAIINDDQVVVSATVPATFSFALSTNTQAMGTLSTSSVVSGSGVATTVITNASNGWLAWLLSANQSLDSATTGDTIVTTGTVNNSPDTLATGAEGYVVDADLTTDSASAGSGSVTIDAEYNGLTTSAGGTLPATFEEYATADGPTDTDVVTLVPRATISGLTQAATDYTDTWTIVAAGNF